MYIFFPLIFSQFGSYLLLPAILSNKTAHAQEHLVKRPPSQGTVNTEAGDDDGHADEDAVEVEL